MRKTLILTLALVIVMAGTAFAGPFADVPAKHWSYDAVNKLAQAGIVEGYGDGTFRGDRTITRYEMAIIVGKAMEHTDKADAETKALIDKLAHEYAKELENLGVRVAALEKKIGNVTWSGQVRQWYQNVDHPENLNYLGMNGKETARHTRLLLWAKAPLGQDMNFIARLTSWGDWGEITPGGDRVGNTLEMDNAYIQGKNFTFGRQPMTLGKGIIWNTGFNTDGATYTFGGDKAKMTLAAFKGWGIFAFPTSPVNSVTALNVVAADVAYKANKDLDFTLTYARNRDSDTAAAGEEIKTWALGSTYTGIKNVTFTGEYGVNSSQAANDANSGDDAKAWVAQAKYRGAQWTTPHTWGVWVGYRNGDPGFIANTGDPLWETAFGVPAINNVKGADYGIEYSIFKNSVLTFNYFDLESKDGTADYKSYTGQLRYFF